jgi:hypothetical protein
MNAYLYNNGDSADAIATAKRYAKPAEVKFVGIPRLSPGTDQKDFAARLARFYAEYPEERPPEPKRVSQKNRRSGRPARLSVVPTARGEVR